MIHGQVYHEMIDHPVSKVSNHYDGDQRGRGQPKEDSHAEFCRLAKDLRAHENLAHQNFRIQNSGPLNSKPTDHAPSVERKKEDTSRTISDGSLQRAPMSRSPPQGDCGEHLPGTNIGSGKGPTPERPKKTRQRRRGQPGAVFNKNRSTKSSGRFSRAKQYATVDVADGLDETPERGYYTSSKARRMESAMHRADNNCGLNTSSEISGLNDDIAAASFKKKAGHRSRSSLGVSRLRKTEQIPWLTLLVSLLRENKMDRATPKDSSSIETIACSPDDECNTIASLPENSHQLGLSLDQASVSTSSTPTGNTLRTNLELGKSEATQLKHVVAENYHVVDDLDCWDVMNDHSYRMGIVRGVKQVLRTGRKVQLRVREETSSRRKTPWKDCELILNTLYMQCVQVIAQRHKLMIRRKSTMRKSRR